LRPVENQLAWWRQASLSLPSDAAPPALADFLT